jgi:hypothetical protein
MATTLANCRIGLSKELNDYWASSATSNGDAGGVTIVDTALQSKYGDWIGTRSNAYDFVTSGTYANEERKIVSLATSTLTTLAHGGQIATAVTYEIHRLFTASEKRNAIIYGARNEFPYLCRSIWDESMVSGNWLIDGSFEVWTTSTNLTHWTETTVTATKTSTAGLVRQGSYSCKLSGAAGTLTAVISSNPDLQWLRGSTITFSSQGWCDTANALRLSISDGITTTYSSYHTGGSTWTSDNPRDNGFYCQQYIDKNAASVTLTIYLTNPAAIAYVDDARVIGPFRSKLYIGHLGFAQNRPIQVDIETSNYSQGEPKHALRNIDVDPSGYMYLPSSTPSNFRLRLRGMGYLQFLSSGVESTDWAATVDIDEPQLSVLYAAAALYLYQQQMMPNLGGGDTQEYSMGYKFWREELVRRQEVFGMVRPSARVNWTI